MTFQLQNIFLSRNNLQTMHHATYLNISLPAIFASSLLTCSPFFASKLRISSLEDRALTYSNKNEKEKWTEYNIKIFVQSSWIKKLNKVSGDELSLINLL